MLLSELFDTSVPYTWTTTLPNDRYVAKFMIGANEYRFSAHVFNYNELTGAEISFCMMDGKKCRTDDTGSGHATLVYGTVIKLISEVADILNLSIIAYDAEGSQRKNIYPTLIKRSLPTWQLIDHQDDWYYFINPQVLPKTKE